MMNMKEKLSKRIGVRISTSDREKLENFLSKSDFRNISDAIRLAIRRFLENEADKRG